MNTVTPSLTLEFGPNYNRLDYIQEYWTHPGCGGVHHTKVLWSPLLCINHFLNKKENKQKKNQQPQFQCELNQGSSFLQSRVSPFIRRADTPGSDLMGLPRPLPPPTLISSTSHSFQTPSQSKTCYGTVLPQGKHKLIGCKGLSKMFCCFSFQMSLFSMSPGQLETNSDLFLV